MIQVQPLTRRQREIFEFIQRFIQAHAFAPSLEEIGMAMNLRSLATVHKHLEQLRLKGYVRRYWNRKRAMELTAGPGCCPTCGRALEIISEEAKVATGMGRKSDIVGSTVDAETSAVPTTTEVP